MPKVVQFIEGDGVNDDWYALTVGIPDANAGNARIEGAVMAKGGTAVNVAVNSDPLPAAPASGLLYFNLQLDPLLGTVTTYSSTVAMPAPVTASDGVSLCRIIYADTLSPASTDPAFDGGATPDTPIGSP